MPLTGKKTGSYAALVGVFTKKTGSYVASPGVFGKLSGTYTRLDDAVAVLSMRLGFNVAWPSTWSGAWMYNNLCLTMDKWERITGAGSFTQDQGVLTPTVGTDEFRAYLADTGDGLPTGTYTVYNPDGCNIAIGNFATATTFHAYTTATQFTFTYSGSSFLGLWCKGGITRNVGNLAIVMPGQTANHLAGNKWNTEFTSFLTALNPWVIRGMDWNLASNNFEKNWADRVQPNRISYTKNGGTFIPWEDMCDFSNRHNLDVWLCVPARATDDYVTNLASVLAANLDADRSVWVEHGNEIWNTATPWKDGLNWVTYLDHTRITATVDPATDTFTATAHGMVEDEPIICFSTLENKSGYVSVTTQMRYGNTAYADVVDANTFKLKVSAGGATLDVATGTVNLICVRANEAGKTTNRDGHYAELSLRDWNTLDAALGVGRVKHICASQSASYTMTANRLGAGLQARADYVAIAPYVYGSWFGTRATPASTQVTPGFWGNSTYGPYTVHHAVYTSGATPTIQNVLDGDGTGYVGKVTQAFSSGSAYADGSAITGLSNGTTYKLVSVVISPNDREWKLSVDFTPEASGNVTVYGYDSYANQAIRNRLDTLSTGSVQVTNHTNVSGGIPIIGYEGGLHFSETAPDQMDTWLANYQESDEHRDMLKHYVYSLASRGMDVFCYYSDCLGVFAMADTYQDITDKRYVLFDGLNGEARQRTQVSVADQSPSFVTEPVSYPTTIHTMSDATLTYSILNGDNRGNYSFNGAALQIANDTGVSWGTESLVTLLCEGSDGYTSDTFTVSFYIGSDNWYEADASFAWSSVDDTDTAQMNPAIGAVVEDAGVTAVAGSGLWDMDGCTYEETNALLATMGLDQPCLFAAVLEKDNQAGTSKNLVQFGVSSGSGSAFIRFMRDVGAFNARFFSNLPTTIDINVAMAADVPASKAVCWVFYDADPTTPTFHAGTNQTTNATQAQSAIDRSVQRYFRFGGSATDSQCKHGSVQAVRRSGLTLTQAKAIIQKMQDHHGI